MTVKMILAADQGNSIGWSNGNLPWRIRIDMQRFKNMTMGHDVVMGRTTYQSLKLPDGLPNRRNVVLTKQKYADVRHQFGNVDIISSFNWVEAHQECLGCTPPDLWIIGGAKVYAEALELKLVDEIYFTQVHTLSGADVILPFEMYGWKLFILRERARGVNWELIDSSNPPTAEGEPPISFLTFKKIK